MKLGCSPSNQGLLGPWSWTEWQQNRNGSMIRRWRKTNGKSTNSQDQTYFLKCITNSPVEWFAPSQQFQHDYSKAVDIAFQRIKARHRDLGGSVSWTCIVIQCLQVIRYELITVTVSKRRFIKLDLTWSAFGTKLSSPESERWGLSSASSSMLADLMFLWTIDGEQTSWRYLKSFSISTVILSNKWETSSTIFPLDLYFRGPCSNRITHPEARTCLVNRNQIKTIKLAT